MNRRVAISLGVIALLLFFLLIANRTRLPDLPEPSKWDTATDEILIEKGGNTLRIYRDGERWLLTDAAYPADGGAVRAMEEKLKGLALTDLISEKPLYERYDLTPDRSIHVTVKAGGAVVRNLTVGKKSSTHQHTYVRLDDRPEIYLASGNLVDELGKSLDELRDKDILKISRNAIESFEITYGGRRLSFSKTVEEKKPEKTDRDAKRNGDKGPPAQKAEKWICNEYRAVALDENQIDQVLTSFDPLRASAFLEDSAGPAKAPRCVVTLKAFGKTVHVSIYDKHGENRFRCTCSESKYGFLLDGWKAERYFKTIDDLRQGR
jgi:hypothetical protein